jgi:hypothetical protein|tara:strand:+ start:175 stop:396 length:222 start_codon:yes stop_codon:yes gene_type:complete
MFGKEEKLMLRDEMNLREIREMVTFLKDSNVKTFEGMGISVEFNMEMEEQPQVIPQFRDPVDQDTMVNSHFRS